MEEKISGTTLVRSSPPIKLKDKIGRSRIVLDLKASFGFFPDVLIIDKIHGRTNAIIVSAVLNSTAILTQEELKLKKAMKNAKKSK